jgi:limonene-1,2-epoxide hydrolase
MVREFLAAWERRDTEFILSCFADDAVYHSIPLSPIVGRDAIREFVQGFADVPPGHLEIHYQIATANLVMNERTDHITLNGTPVSLPICGVFEVEGGKIKAWREYFDLSLARAAHGGS